VVACAVMMARLAQRGPGQADPRVTFAVNVAEQRASGRPDAGTARIAERAALGAAAEAAARAGASAARANLLFAVSPATGSAQLSQAVPLSPSSHHALPAAGCGLPSPLRTQHDQQLWLISR
jgi:hypothetical protein